VIKVDLINIENDFKVGKVNGIIKRKFLQIMKATAKDILK